MNARRRLAARRDWPPNLYQNGNGYLWFKNPENGNTVGLGYDLEKAKRQVKRANLEIARRQEEKDLLEMTASTGPTLAEHCKAYEDQYAVGKKNTVIAMKSQLKAIMSDARSKKAIDKFTPKDAADMVKEAVENRGANMAGTIRARLKDVFRDAILHGLVERNPVDVVLRPRATVSRARMSIEDFKAIYEQADSWLQNAMLAALVTGQRISDVRKFRFDDIRDGYLWVIQEKTGMKLKIPVTATVNGWSVQRVIEKCRDKAVSKFLVHFPVDGFQTKRGAQISQSALNGAFVRARGKAKLSVPDGATPTTFHEIRSLSARLHTETNGKDFAQALLGHSSAAMTELYRDVRGQQWIEVKTA